MPLVRVEVRNEYRLGVPEMYREATNNEEPKEILEGVAVAGLVGVLRQLGDLADFAAEVFHGLQEEVMITSSRSHKLMGRVQRIEAVLSPLEKAVLVQRSHLHFAYTAGSNWHADIRYDNNHFVYGDLPQFILDSYEDCRDPPRLHLLDRFDPGGPGSCLKRYSDPTFFKRASVASDEASIKKVLKDQEEQNIKKRRSWCKNGEVSRSALLSHQNGRFHFTRMNEGRHASPSQSISTCDASTLRSDLSEQSNSDLRNGSGHGKGDSRASYSLLLKERESRHFSTYTMKRHDSNYQDYNFLKEEITDACDNIQINPTKGQDGFSSSSINWDEQTAILEPKVQDYDDSGLRHNDDRDRNLILLSPKVDPESPADDAVNFEIVDKMDVQTSNQTFLAFRSDDNHLDNFENETDHFMDALNNIEPGSDSDRDSMRKQADCYSRLEDKAAEHGLPELIKHNLGSRTSNSESSVLANNSPINGGFERNPISKSSPPSTAFCSVSRVSTKDKHNSIAPVDEALQSAQMAGDSLNSGNPQSNDSVGNDDIKEGTNVESVPCTLSSNFRDSRSGMPVIGGTTTSYPDSQKPAPEAFNVTSVTFWTNGGLLGLQPSKPPDFSVLNDFPEDHLFRKDGKISSSSEHLILSDKDPGKPDKTESLKNIEEDLNTDSSTCQEYQESAISFRKTTWKISPSDLDIKLGVTGDLLHLRNASSTGASITASGSSLPVNTDFQAARKHPKNTRTSYQMFELSNRLLTTGSGKKLLHGADENSRHASYQNSNFSEKKNHQNFAYHTFPGNMKDFFGGESQILSPSSPPLAPMKISFQPIDDFETSKLKLNFPDGHSNDETGRDCFPSFQLVPEVLNTQHNAGSASDDDTFDRSSPSVSDDCRSHQSESNSEQWETGESPSSKDPGLYDSLCGISLTESVPTVLGNERTCQGDIREPDGIQCPLIENSMQNSHSFCVDLQNLNTLDHSSQELSNDTNSKDLVEPKFANTIDPPSSPPAQQRGMKPHLDDMEDRCEVTPKGSTYAFDLKHLDCTISQQPKPAPINHDQILETPNQQKSKPFRSRKSNRRREANQGKSTDENEDFLSQIRTKSFNLRPTVPAKPTIPSGTSNVQVTAILEKANAIRQAVGSEDDDDEWSDT